jgi:hypothetical protein
VPVRRRRKRLGASTTATTPAEKQLAADLGQRRGIVERLVDRVVVLPSDTTGMRQAD